MSKVKQVIVMRKDVQMRKGKMIAQGAHASMKVLLDTRERSGADSDECLLELTPEMCEWLAGSFAKICVYVNSEEELLMLYKQAQDANIPSALITDSGRTEFHGVPTNTCIAIGPALSIEIDKITGHLKLL
ncbi:aminoacyl-tRNA hydrolase [Candidatus Pacearchaeota archaeon]|nr:aminoacyl-tRNA hydrolase [Candidatus Pacearchaeota archaeon]|tara:strand:- start:517 stop:909 length:393 start_codon:yes stop_codon:yes gene_type:complete